jgi:hypothetical protein
MLVVGIDGVLYRVDHEGTSDGAFYRAVWLASYGVQLPVSQAITVETLREYAAGKAISL